MLVVANVAWLLAFSEKEKSSKVRSFSESADSSDFDLSDITSECSIHIFSTYAMVLDHTC